MKKIIAIVFSILGLTAIGIASLYFGLQSFQPIKMKSEVATPVIQRPEQNAFLLEALLSTGVKNTEEISLVLHESLPNDARGYYGVKTISIKAGLDYEQTRRTVTHEYLHYIWYEVMTDEERLALSDKVLQAYSRDEEMKPRVAGYIAAGDLTSTELFSIYCTEVNDQIIASFVDECNKYFDRSTIQLLR